MGSGNDKGPHDGWAKLEAKLDTQFAKAKRVRRKPRKKDLDYSRKREKQVFKKKAELFDVFIERYKTKTNVIASKVANQESENKLKSRFFSVVTGFLIISTIVVFAAIGIDTFVLEKSKLDSTIVSTVFTVLIAGLVSIVYIVAKGLFSSNK